MKRVEKIQRVCEAYQVPLQAAALQFPLRHPIVSSVVVGTSSVESMKKNITFSEFLIPDELWEALKNENLVAMDSPGTAVK